MKQTATRDLYRIWTALRGARPAPDRADIDPAQLVSILPHVFLLESNTAQNGRIRLAGTHLCAAFDAELRGRPFRDLWRAEDRSMIDNLLNVMRDEAAAIVIGASEDATDAAALQAELVLLPLRSPGLGLSGALCACVVRGAPGAVRRPIVQLAIETQRVSWPSGRTQSPESRLTVPALVHVGARREGRFYVYDGGRA